MTIKGPDNAITLKLCGCGTNHNAIDTAFAILKQHLTPVDGEMCAVYAAGVAEALQTMVAQMVRAAMRTHAIAEGRDEAKLVQDSAVHALSGVATAVHAGFYNNHQTNTALANFLCDDCGATEKDRKPVAGGPAYVDVLRAGYVPPEEERAGLSQAIIAHFLSGILRPKG